MKNLIAGAWHRFLDWITRVRLGNFVMSAVGEIHGPVRHVGKLRDGFIVITDRDVYAVYYDDAFGRYSVRRWK